jgi:hypothetical protein
MTNRQRLGTFLLTSALVGGFVLPTVAAESSVSPSTSAASAKKAVTAAPVSHKVTKVTARVVQPAPAPRLIEIASSAPMPSQQCTFWCSYPLLLGIAY